MKHRVGILTAVSITGSVFCSSCDGAPDAPDKPKVVLPQQIGTSSQKLSDKDVQAVKNFGAVAGEISGFVGKVKAIQDVLNQVGEWLGLLDPTESMATQIQDLAVELNQATEAIGGVVIEQERENDISDMVSDFNNVAGKLQSGTPIDQPLWDLIEVNTSNATARGMETLNYARLYLATDYSKDTDTDGATINDQGGLPHTWKDVIPVQSSDLLYNSSLRTVYDWRLGIPSFMQRLSVRLPLMAMQHPDFILTGIYQKEIIPYHDALVDQLSKLDAGLRCNVAYLSARPNADPHEFKFVPEYLVSCADIYSGIYKIQDVVPPVDTSSCCAIEDFPITQQDLKDVYDCNTTCLADSDWYKQTIVSLQNYDKQEVHNETPWFETRALADSLLVIANNAVDLTNTMDMKIHVAAPNNLCLTATSSTGAGAVTIATCSNDANASQRWNYDRISQTIVNVSSGFCLEAPDCRPDVMDSNGNCPAPTDSTAGTPLVTDVCRGYDTQRWTYSLDDQVLHNARGMVAEIAADSPVSDAIVWADWRTGGDNQRWAPGAFTSILLSSQQASASGWVTNPAPVTLQTTNAPPGSVINWGNTPALGNTYTGPITLSEGQNTIYYGSTDPAGNAEPVRESIINVDTRAPTATAILSSNYTALNFTVTDPTPGSGPAGLHAIVTVGGTASAAQFVAGASGTLSVDPTFQYIEYWAEDVAGNQGAHAFVWNYPSKILNDAPVGYWRLGESQPYTAFDASPAANNGTWVAGYRYYQINPNGAPPRLGYPGAIFGDLNTASNFYINNDYKYSPPTESHWVTVADNPNQHMTKAISLEAWFTMGSPNQTYSALISKSTANWQDGYGLYYYVNNVYFFINNLNIRVGVPVSPTSTYHHVVGTYDHSQLSIYLDGVLTQTRAYSADINPSSAPLQIGNAWILSWTGNIDEAAIYDKALSAKQVGDHFNAGRGLAPAQ
jgi:hypothetical protein